MSTSAAPGPLQRLARLRPRWPWTQAASRDDVPTSAPLDPAAQPFHGGDGPVGVLLCHGFTGSPVSMRPWADHLLAAGFRVSLPLLPGHGTSWQDLNRVVWQDWYAEVERALRVLRRSCELVFVCGLSMGGALALRLAEQHGSDVAGLVLVNPAVRSSDARMAALPLLKRVLPSTPGIASDIAKADVLEGGYLRTPLHAAHSMMGLWSDVRSHLKVVDQPIMIFRSAVDHVVHPRSTELIMASVSSADVTERVLARSFHVATMDYDAEEIFTGSVDFIRRIAGVRADHR